MKHSPTPYKKNMKHSPTPYKKGRDLAKEALAARRFKNQFEAQEDDWTNRFAKEVALYAPGDKCIAVAYVGSSDQHYDMKPLRVRVSMRPFAKLTDDGYFIRYIVQPLKSDGTPMLRRSSIWVDENDMTPAP